MCRREGGARVAYASRRLRHLATGSLAAGAAALGLVVLGTTPTAYAQTTSGYTQVSGAPFAESSTLAGAVGQSLAVDPMGDYLAVAGLGPGSGQLSDSADLDVALYSVGATGTLSLATGLVIPTVADPVDRIDSMAFSPDGKELAITMGAPATVQLVEVDTSGRTPVLTEGPSLFFLGSNGQHEKGLTSVAFSLSGSFLAASVGSIDESMLATYSYSSSGLHLIAKATLPDVDGYAPAPRSLSFSTGGRFLVAGLSADEGEKCTVALLSLDPHTGGDLQVLSDTTPTGPLPLAIAFDPQSDIVAVGTSPLFETVDSDPGAVWLYRVDDPDGPDPSLSAYASDPVETVPDSVVSGVMFAPSGQDLVLMTETKGDSNA